VQQLALLLPAFSSRWSCRLCHTPGQFNSARVKLYGTARNKVFTENERQSTIDHYIAGWGFMLSNVVYFLLMVFWWGGPYCAPNSYEWTWTAVNAHLWVWPTTVPSRDWRTILFLGTESHQSLTFLFFLVHHLGFIMWPWNPSTSWPTPSPSSCPPPPPSTASPWTTQHLPSHHSSPLLGQPPSLTMPPTTTLPFSQSPPEHAFCTPHIFTYTGPIDSQRQRSHLSHLLLHDLRHSIQIRLRRRVPLLLLHMLLTFGPTLRPTTRRPRHLPLSTPIPTSTTPWGFP